MVTYLATYYKLKYFQKLIVCSWCDLVFFLQQKIEHCEQLKRSEFVLWLAACCSHSAANNLPFNEIHLKLKYANSCLHARNLFQMYLWLLSDKQLRMQLQFSVFLNSFILQRSIQCLLQAAIEIRILLIERLCRCYDFSQMHFYLFSYKLPLGFFSSNRLS